MKVFVTGGTGFVGRQVLQRLSAAGHQTVCLVRPGSEGKLPRLPGLTTRFGDVTDPASLIGALAGCQAVIHLVGILRELPARKVTFERLHPQATAHLVRAAEAQGVPRFLHMSANGARQKGSTAYYRTKWQAEQVVRDSALRWTIFRPSLIFGAEDQFCTMLAKQIRRLPLVPVIGDGNYRLAPVAVDDVAAGFVRALQQPSSEGRSYTVCGPESLTFNVLLDQLGGALGVPRVRKLHLPLPLLRPVVACLQKWAWFPLTKDLVTMLLSGNTGDPGPWLGDFAIARQYFSDTVRRQLH